MAKAHSQLLSLPAEIRDQIWHASICNIVHNSDIESAPDSTPIFDPAIPYLPGPLSLQLTSRQVRREVNRILHASFFFWERTFFSIASVKPYEASERLASLIHDAIRPLPRYHQRRANRLALELVIRNDYEYNIDPSSIRLADPGKRHPRLKKVLLRVTLEGCKTDVHRSKAERVLLGHLRLLERFNNVIVEFHQSCDPIEVSRLIEEIEDKIGEKVEIIHLKKSIEPKFATINEWTMPHYI